jgi:hypothetical protein
VPILLLQRGICGCASGPAKLVDATSMPPAMVSKQSNGLAP